MKIAPALDGAAADRLIKQRRDQQSATDVWLRQMEAAMLVQPAPVDAGDAGPVASRPLEAAPPTSRAIDRARGTCAGSVPPPVPAPASAPGATPLAVPRPAPLPAHALTVHQPKYAAMRSVSDTGPSNAAAASAIPAQQAHAMAAPGARPVQQTQAGMARPPMTASSPAHAMGSGEPTVAAAAADPSIARTSQVAGIVAGAASSAASATLTNRPGEVGTAASADDWAVGARPVGAAARTAIAAGLRPTPANGVTGEPGNAEEPHEAADPVSDAAATEAPSRREMRLARDGDQVQVTIRDTALALGDQWALVGRIAAQLQASGMQLRTLTINGTQRFLRETGATVAARDSFAPPTANAQAASDRATATMRGKHHGR